MFRLLRKKTEVKAEPEVEVEAEAEAETQPALMPENAPPLAFPGYERRRACDQNGVDLVSGWISRIPIEGLTTGSLDLFHDPRIQWAVEQAGSIDGMNILELGPLDGGHSYLLDKLGAGRVLAIEAGKSAFLRCLMVKNLLGMPSVKFMLGDFREWLETTTDRYDMIVASGVLYHMPDPLRLLELLAEKTDKIYLWTHYFSDDEMPPGDLRRGAFIGEPTIKEWRGMKVRLWHRQYHMPTVTTEFCGGLDNDHTWMDGQDIPKVLRELGFGDIRTCHGNADGPNGPSSSFFAKR